MFLLYPLEVSTKLFKVGDGVFIMCLGANIPVIRFCSPPQIEVGAKKALRPLIIHCFLYHISNCSVTVGVFFLLLLFFFPLRMSEPSSKHVASEITRTKTQSVQTHFSSVAKRWQENDPRFSVPSVNTRLRVEQTSSDNVK